MIPTSILNSGPIGILAPPDQPWLGLSAWGELRWWIGVDRLRLLTATDLISTATARADEVELVWIPDITPAAMPAVLALWEAGIPVVTRASEAAQAWVHTGAHRVSPEAGGQVVAAELERLLADCSEREALVRRGRAQRRRLERRLADAGSTPTAEAHATPLPPMLSRPQVSVIIPTRGGPNVRACVAALRRAALETDLQVILVVTGGASELPPCERVVSCEPPFIWAKANNAGLQVATGTFVLLLNDDAFFTGEGDLDRMLQVMAQWPYLAALGPISPGISRYFPQYGEAPIEGGVFVPTERPLCGHCLLVRRECFQAVGPFDETFVDYGGDELDWLWRARQTGYRWGLHEGVFVEHVGAATYGERAREWQAGKERFEAKHGVRLQLSEPWSVRTPDVSWTIASYEGARYLSHCLDSIRACSRGLDFEIVLAVDGSDRAPYRDVLAHYDDLPLRVAFFEKAASVGEAKNRALRMARGRVLFPFDDDDMALRDHRDLLEALDGVEMAYGELKVRWGTGECSDFPREPATFASLMERHRDTIFPAQCVALRRELADRYYFREDLPACEDYELWLRMARDGVRMRHCAGKTVALYCQHPGSCARRSDLKTLNERLRAEYAPYVPVGSAPEAPVYSYVIPAWNEAERLSRCLESVLACAPAEPFEVILADDGSTDATLAVARAYLERLPLRLHPFPKAPTVSVAYNRALRQARGEYLLLLDADDETTPERIPQLRAVLDQTGADFVYGGYVRLTPRGPEPFHPEPWEVARTQDRPQISPCAALFHRRILDAGHWLREELPAGEDRIWMLDLDRAGVHLVAAPEVIAHRYWMNPGSVVRRYPVRAIIQRYAGVPAATR